MFIINEAMQIQGEFEGEYGGESNAVEKMLVNRDQREISGAVRQFLRVTENFNEMMEGDVDGARTVAKSVGISREMERLNKLVSDEEAKFALIDNETTRCKRSRNEFMNTEMQRSLLTRWVATLDELEYALKILQHREDELHVLIEKNEAEEAKLNVSVGNLLEEKSSAAKKHEKFLSQVRPQMMKLENDSKKHQRTLENLLLDVNLTTGLFKKRETKVAQIAAKISKTRDAKSQVEVERRRYQVEYATLVIDSKRNSKILQVVMDCNDVAKKDFIANRTVKNEYKEEIIDNESLLKELAEEKKDLGEKVRVTKDLLEEQERKNRYLATFHSKLQGDLDKKTAEVADVLSKFNDENHQVLRNLQKDVKDIILKNKETREEIKAAKIRCEELTKNAALVEGKLKDTLVEFS